MNVANKRRCCLHSGAQRLERMTAPLTADQYASWYSYKVIAILYSNSPHPITPAETSSLELMTAQSRFCLHAIPSGLTTPGREQTL